MIQDGIYQYSKPQAFGPSTPVLVQISGGQVVRYDWGTYKNLSLRSDQAAQVLLDLTVRIADHARFGAQLEFSPALVVTLSNPVTGPVSVPLCPGGAA
jgi:hypothetical protein